MSTFTRFIRALRHPGPSTAADFDLGDLVARPSPNAMAGWVKGMDHRGRILVEDFSECERWVKPDRFVKVTSRRELWG